MYECIICNALDNNIVSGTADEAGRYRRYTYLLYTRFSVSTKNSDAENNYNNIDAGVRERVLTIYEDIKIWHPVYP